MMLYKELITEVDEEGISEETREKRIKKLREFIKSQSYLDEDEYGSTITGGREIPSELEE